MKKIITFLFIFPLWGLGGLYAQKEVWGVTPQTNFTQTQGNIVKFDLNGENAVTMHYFNYPTGKLPQGKLFLASNGKLYGTAVFGGIGSTTNTNFQDGYGVLYEYDLIFDSYRVVYYFDTPGIPNSNQSYNPYTAVIEPIPGKLYGAAANRFYVYDIATETVTFLNHTYSFVAMGNINDLIKGSNGFLYGVSNQAFACTSPSPNQPNQGSIIKINTTTNTAQRVANFNCDTSTGIGGEGMVEAIPNKIFFSSSGGAVFFPDQSFALAGSIVEFDMVTNTLTTRALFNFSNGIGYEPHGLVLNANGNLYGVCAGGGDTYRNGYPQTVFNKTGTIFEFNPTSYAITKLIDLDLNRFLPVNLIKLSTGDYMGNLASSGLFKYITSTNSLQLPNLITYSELGEQFSTKNLIEICRKPAYHFFDVTTFDGCIGGNFTYDIQNTNATSYQWQKNNVAVSGQTTGVLNLTNLTTNDAGAYTCIMTNECGTTTTMVLNLTVNCLGTNTVAQLDKVIKLYPNPTKNILNIKLPENIEINVTGVTMANSLGQLVCEQNNTNTTIDVSQLQSGIYFINLTTNYGDWKGKFIKE